VNQQLPARYAPYVPQGHRRDCSNRADAGAQPRQDKQHEGQGDGRHHEHVEEYRTVSEVAEQLRVSPKRLRNMMAAGIFVEGEHFFRPRGLGPRFLWSRVRAWPQGQDVQARGIPMARDRRRLAPRAPEV